MLYINTYYMKKLIVDLCNKIAIFSKKQGKEEIEK